MKFPRHGVIRSKIENILISPRQSRTHEFKSFIVFLTVGRLLDRKEAKTKSGSILKPLPSRCGVYHQKIPTFLKSPLRKFPCALYDFR